MERKFLYGYLIFATIVYIRWALYVIEKFCSHLKISCLTIPYGEKSYDTPKKLLTSQSKASTSTQNSSENLKSFQNSRKSPSKTSLTPPSTPRTRKKPISNYTNSISIESPRAMRARARLMTRGFD